MRWMENAAFFLYLAALARCDFKSKKIPAVLILTGALAGLGIRLAEVLSGQAGLSRLLAAWPGLLPGLFMLLLVKPSRGGIGAGDGLCFLSFSLWQEAGFLFGLLFISLLLLAVTGLVLIGTGKGKKEMRLPLMPFVLLTAASFFLWEMFAGALP